MEFARTIPAWKLAVYAAALLVWTAGDFLWLSSSIGASVSQCMDGGTRSERKMEAVVCSLRLFNEGTAGWLAFLWTWGPLAVVAAILLLRGRRVN